MHAVDGGASCELGSPVYNASGELIALVVKQSRTGGVSNQYQIPHPLALKQSRIGGVSNQYQIPHPLACAVYTPSTLDIRIT
jgi:hypothetical protein